MERKSSTEYSVVFFRKAKKVKLIRLHLCCRFRAANWVGTTLEFAVFRSGPDPKYSSASAFWFFLSCPQPWFFAAVRTHFPKKNIRVYRNTVTCVTRVTSNRVEVHRSNSQHLAMVRTSNMVGLVPSGISVYNHDFCSGPNTFP